MLRSAKILFLVLCISASSCFMAFALNPDEKLSDPVMEERARSLSTEIRCTVCQNQSIEDSDAPLAKDLRVLVREKMVEGSSDEEILDFLVARYGEFILLKPKFGSHTLVLWAFPAVLLLLAIVAAGMRFRNKDKLGEADGTLTAAEKKALSRIVDPES